MTTDQMEATLRLHGWQQGATSRGNYVWFKDGRNAVGISITAGVFTCQPWVNRHLRATDELAHPSYGEFRELFERIVESKEGL